MEEQMKQALIRLGRTRHAHHNRGPNIRPRDEWSLEEDVRVAMLRIMALADELAEEARKTG